MAMANSHNDVVRAVVASLLVACTLIIAASPYGAKAEISCQEVAAQLAPCVSHIMLGGGVSPACCQGVKEAAAQVKTSADLGASCQCVKDNTARIPRVNYNRVNEVAGQCNTTVPYVVNPDLDCSKLTIPN